MPRPISSGLRRWISQALRQYIAVEALLIDKTRSPQWGAGCLSSRRERLPARLARLVAIGAVHRLIPSGLERYECFLPAPGAGSGEHLPLRAIVAAVGASSVGSTRVATTGAPLGATGGAALRILVATTGVELLVVSGEGELLVALDTGKGTVVVIQVFQLSLVSLVNADRTGRLRSTIEVQSVPGRS